MDGQPGCQLVSQGSGWGCSWPRVGEAGCATPEHELDVMLDDSVVLEPLPAAFPAEGERSAGQVPAWSRDEIEKAGGLVE